MLLSCESLVMLLQGDGWYCWNAEQSGHPLVENQNLTSFIPHVQCSLFIFRTKVDNNILMQNCTILTPITFCNNLGVHKYIKICLRTCFKLLKTHKLNIVFKVLKLCLMKRLYKGGWSLRRKEAVLMHAHV